MRVAICCKAVPANAMLESVCTVEGDIRYEDTKFFINEVDSYALQAAVNLKNLYKAQTVALTVGPLRAQEVLYAALAMGVDEVLRIDGETSLPEIISVALVSSLKELNPQLILVGTQSEDWMGGEVGIYISQALNTSLAFAVMEICELNDACVRIRKEIGGGRQAEMRLELPAVLCIQTGMTPVPYLSAIRRKKAMSLPVKSGGELDKESVKQTLSGMMAYEIKDVSIPSKEGHAVMLTGERPEMARKVLEIVRNAL